MALVFGKWGACVAALGASACGVSVGQPIGFGVGAAEDAAADAADAQKDGGTDPLTEGLVAYWRLDEKRSTDVVIDSSQRGHSGIAVNGPNPSASLPPVGFPDSMSRAFDGVNQYVVVGNTDEINFEGEITMAAWVNIAAITDGCQDIVAHGYCYCSDPGEVALRLGSASCGSGGAAHTWEAGTWQNENHFATAPLYDLDLKKWIHIAGTYDGRTWHLYRNGEEIASLDSSLGAIRVESDWAIGGRAPSVPSSPDRFFAGSIDDVRIYRRALSAAEVLELYHH